MIVDRERQQVGQVASRRELERRIDQTPIVRVSGGGLLAHVLADKPPAAFAPLPALFIVVVNLADAAEKTSRRWKTFNHR